MSKSIYIILGLALLGLVGGLYFSSTKTSSTEVTFPSDFPSELMLRESVEDYLLIHCDKSYDHWRADCGFAGKALYDYSLDTFTIDEIAQITPSSSIYRVWFTGGFTNSNNERKTVSAPIDVTKVGNNWEIDPYVVVPAQ